LEVVGGVCFLGRRGGEKEGAEEKSAVRCARIGLGLVDRLRGWVWWLCWVWYMGWRDG